MLKVPIPQTWIAIEEISDLLAARNNSSFRVRERLIKCVPSVEIYVNRASTCNSLQKLLAKDLPSSLTVSLKKLGRDCLIFGKSSESSKLTVGYVREGGGWSKIVTFKPTSGSDGQPYRCKHTIKNEKALKFILGHSKIRTQKRLLRQFDKIEESGFYIVASNSYANASSTDMNFTLKDYLVHMSLVPSGAITLQGKVISRHPVAQTLTQQFTAQYSPEKNHECIISLCCGFSPHLSKTFSGVLVYEKNRLASVYRLHRRTNQSKACVCLAIDNTGSRDFSLIKSSSSEIFSSFLECARRQLALLGHTYCNDPTIPERWTHCNECTKWRQLPHVRESQQANQCSNPSSNTNSCTVSTNVSSSPPPEENSRKRKISQGTSTYEDVVSSKKKQEEMICETSGLKGNEIILDSSDSDDWMELSHQFRSQLNETKRTLNRLHYTLTEFLNMAMPGGIKSDNSVEELIVIMKAMVQSQKDKERAKDTRVYWDPITG